MFVFKSIENLQQHLSSFSADKTIGFAPTMGALHKGHLSLVKESMELNDITVVSIFVNPTQFDKADDLDKYPRTLDTDIALLKTIDCDIVFAPSASEMYRNNIQSESFNFDGLEHVMEGEFRSGHFDGVGTVVKRLFEIVKPHNAYFGEKDFQQLQIIKKLVSKHDIPVSIVGCSIFREDDGLAMSSRNSLLTESQRSESPFIYAVLKDAKTMFKAKEPQEIINWVKSKFEEHSTLKLEYFQIADESTLKSVEHKKTEHTYRAFIAVFADKVRLIDNIQL